MGAQCGSPKAQSLHETEAQRHLDNHFEESQVTKKLAAMLKETNEKVFPTSVEQKHPFVVNLGLVMVQSKQQQRYKQALTAGAGSKFRDMGVLMRASRYVRYAMAAYNSGQEEIMKAITLDDGDSNGNLEILHVHRSERPADCPNFFVAVDKSTGDVVLSISGHPAVEATIHDAAAPTQLTNDVRARLEGKGDGFANGAILKLSQQVIQKAKEPLENAFNSQEKKASGFSIVGHGTGAGAAILVTLQGFGGDSVVDGLLSKGKARCYAFGAPPVFEPGKAPLPANTTSAIFCFVNGMDIVPRVSLGTVGKLLVAVRHVDEMDMKSTERLQILSGEAETTEVFPDCGEIPEEMRAELKVLPPIGTTVQIFKGSDSQMILQKVQREQLDRILIHESMFKDHALSAYEEAIDETLAQLQRSRGCC